LRSLLQHFEDVARILGEFESTPAHWEEEPEIALRDSQQGQLTFRLRYRDGSLLSVDLVADCSNDDLGIQWTRYSFHYQDKDDQQRFRYDNVPHHRDLPNFPHHLHIRNALSAEGPPSIREVARRVHAYLSTLV